MENRPKISSFFWPVVLIGAGVVLLLRNLELIPAFNIGLLLRLWPLILVVIGLDLLLGRKAPWVGGLIGLLAVGGVIAFLFLSPSLGVSSVSGTKTDVISTPANGVTSVKYYLNTSADPVTIEKSDSPEDLISGTITHRGTLNYDVSGTTEKVVKISETIDSDTWFQWGFVFSDHKWEIRLNPDVPTDVILDGGSGALSVDLSGVKLNSLRAAMGSGSSRFDLPISTEPYEAEIESGSGAVNIKLPGQTNLELTLDTGSGAVNVTLPQSSGLRIEVLDSGSGNLNIPSRMDQVSGTSVSETGTWQSSGFETATYKIVIKILSRGSGSISIN